MYLLMLILIYSTVMNMTKGEIKINHFTSFKPKHHPNMYKYVAVQYHYWHSLVFSFVSYTLQYKYITIHDYNGKCQIAPRSKMEPQHLHLQTTVFVTHLFILW